MYVLSTCIKKVKLKAEGPNVGLNLSLWDTLYLQLQKSWNTDLRRNLLKLYGCS